MKDLSKYGIPDKLISFRPPFIANILDKKYALIQGFENWIEVSMDVELEDLRERWSYPEKENKEVIKAKEYAVKSSKGDKNYNVKVVDGVFSCTCAGFGYRRNCSHIDKIKKEIKN